MSDHSHPDLIEEQERTGEPIYSQAPRSGSKVNVDYFDPSGVQELRTTLSRLSNPGGEIRKSSRESDVATLAEEDAPFDFEKILKGLLSKYVFSPPGEIYELTVYRVDESGIQKRELGVMFKDLRVVGLGATASYQPTIGALFNPKIILENISMQRNPPVRDILSGFSGVVRPGEMLRT